MTHTEHPAAKTPAPTIGFFAALRAFLHPLKRTGIALVTLCATLAVSAALCLFPSLASAAPSREFDTQLAGLTPPDAPVPGSFSSPWGIAVGPADSVWVSDIQRAGVISTYDPSGGYLSQQTGGAGEGRFVRGEGIRSFALDDATGSLYVIISGTPPILEIFDQTGAFLSKFKDGHLQEGEPLVALDNSGGSSQGRIYTVENSDPVVWAFEPGATPTAEVHDFEAVETYIKANTITGTPGGPLTSPGGIATDSQGDIYVVGGGIVDEFKASGEFVQAFTGAGVPSPPLFARQVAVDPTNGNLLIAGSEAGTTVIDEFDPSGAYLGQITATPSGPFDFNVRGIAVNSEGYLYVVDNQNHVVDEFLPVGDVLPEATTEPATEIEPSSAVLHAKADPNGGGPITACRFSYVDDADYRPWEDDPYAAGPSAATAPCLNGAGETVGTPEHPIESPTELHALIELAAITTPNTGTTYHWRISLANEDGTRGVLGEDFLSAPAVTALETAPATEITNQGAVLNGSFIAEAGLETHYFFEYGASTNYAHKSPEIALPDTATGTQQVEAAIEGLVPGTTYHFRLVAENKYGTTDGEDREFTTFQPPAIEAFSSSDVTATGAVLHAKINPNGSPTRYHFEYGTTPAYGASIPLPGAEEEKEEIKEGLIKGHSVEVHLENLQQGATYHFRILAQSAFGTVTSEDQTFEFFPPACPNSAVRQQTGSAYLPDCRAYELVSPGSANGTLLYPGGPNTGQATSPSRFSYVGAFSAPPEADNTIGTDGDLYVSTRTDAGWVSRYIGLPGNETGCMGGPPNNPWSHATFADKIQNNVLTDPGMDRFLDFDLGTGFVCISEGNGTGDAAWNLDLASNAPYLWSSDGTLLAHLPTDLASTPGAAAALACPTLGPQYVIPQCTGDVAASADLTHFVFSSRSFAFAPGGLVAVPGSAYDDNLATGAITLISTLKKDGHPIPQDPDYAHVPPERQSGNGPIIGPGGEEEFLRFPAVSADGSHILISTATADTNKCGGGGESDLPCPRFTDTPIHLYMSIDDEPAIELSESEITHQNVAVNYVGMTADSAKVYFTSAQQLTAEDSDTSTDLYMWSEEGQEEGHPLTLLSKADNAGNPGEPGNTDQCHPALGKTWSANSEEQEAAWTSKCGVVPYSSWASAVQRGGLGGNGISDSAIASQNGDIYFYSPEQLDGDRGALNQQNLYDYRGDRPHYVTTLSPDRYCVPRSSILGPARCLPSGGPILRLQISPDDTHMAFLTADRITSYDNTDPEGSCQHDVRGNPTGETHCTEMYSYTPSTGAIVCDSCNPDGHAPTSPVFASQNGLFLTDDGRALFATAESLVPQDTNAGTDVYEFVAGHAQLITPGTGTPGATGTGSTSFEIPGLVGVSADGTDVYFSTLDTLTSEDHNGNFLKFYDARTNGGFPQPPPVQPCAAAEECHGPGTEAPELPTQGTAASLAGGNVTTEPHKHHRKKHHKRAQHKRHHRRRDAR